MLFNFKHFTVNQDKTAMKVGTDSVLLGAWISLKNNPYSILDIGTGTGLIALQLAQRSNAEVIDALDINDNAFEQAVENFEQSDWSDRLFCYHASLKEFSTEIDDKYDLIVSNPPFYTDAYKSGDDSRNAARFTSSLPFDELIQSVSKLLNVDGEFSVIIPYKEETNFISLASECSLFPTRICNVRGNVKSDIKRSLITFTFHKTKIIVSELTIEIERHQYTDAYINLVKDFYLKM